VRPVVRVVLPCWLLSVLAMVPGVATARRHVSTPDLIRVITPEVRATVPAHPDVNVIVRFVTGADGNTQTDAPGVRARLNGHDVSSRFAPLVENGTQVGVRARIPRDLVRVGHRSNRLHLSARAKQANASGRREQQVVRVRFRAEEAPNRPPRAEIVSDSLVVRPGIPVHFDASESRDPELDALEYQWDFGDGSPPSGDVAPVHTYARADTSRTVRLTVSDGQANASASITLLSCEPPPGHTPGTLVLGADAPLEFGSVLPGASATRTFEVQNTSSDPNSWLAVCLAADDAAFTVSPTRLDLRSGESGTITVTFAPAMPGHAAATIALAASSDNRPFVAVLGHGYGGASAGPGPTQAAAPLFYAASAPALSGTAVRGFRPDGTPISPDIGVHACVVPGDGAGSGDACLVDADCAGNGGTCPQTSVCPSGGEVCAGPADCPDAGACPSYTLFDAAEFCGDGGGGLYLLSNDGVFTDPMPSDTDADRSEGVLRVTLDAGGQTTGHAILDRTTSGTDHLACDDVGAGAGGNVYLAEYHQVPDSGDCVRSEKESLVAVHKSDGSTRTLLPRIDAAEGLSECMDDLDPVTHLEASPDGARFFASFETGGLWRLSPAPLQFVDGSYRESVFRVHPDGSIVFATVVDGPTTAKVSVFKVSPAQATLHSFAESGIASCGTFHVPNNRGSGGSAGGSLLAGIGVAPSSDGLNDATVLVSFATASLAEAAADPTSRLRAENLSVRGTIAFVSPPGAMDCTPLGIVNLERLDQLTF
jgi:PKD repeat protein